MNYLSKNEISDLLKKLVEVIVQDLQPKRIILFGSFGRGDAVIRSDIDLALEVGESVSDEDWLDFLHRISEKNLTLRKIDILRIDKCSEDILESIKKEGITLYESKK